MIVKTIPFSWILEEERRFDCGPFTRGGIEAKKLLERVNYPKQPLSTVTQNGVNGIYHVGMDKLRWVDDPTLGVPFLRSADILKADLSGQPYIAKKQADDNPLFLCPAGTTLITRSGTVGRMAYCRAEMSAMAISQDVLKVVPNTTLIRSGYLHAFLSSKFGIPLVVSGTFGSIIVHIEAENIADLPVPRLNDDRESEVHGLIQGAADGRSRAIDLKRTAILELGKELGLSDLSRAPLSTSFITFSVPAVNLKRLDAAYHSPSCVAAARELEASCSSSERLGLVAKVFTPGIFKRPYVEDPAYGYPYYSGSELFQYAPTPRGYLSRRAANINEYLVQKNWLLVQDAGQLGGLIGKITRVGENVSGGVVSNHLMRVVPRDDHEAAFLFAVLASPHGYRSITRHAFGTSIPQLDPKHISEMEVPWPSEAIRNRIAKLVLESWELDDRANAAETAAVKIVEEAIEAAA